MEKMNEEEFVMIGSKTRVVIVGAGFGGMVAAQKLATKECGDYCGGSQ